jgi:hypothetical protein
VIGQMWCAQPREERGVVVSVSRWQGQKNINSVKETIAPPHAHAPKHSIYNRACGGGSHNKDNTSIVADRISPVACSKGWQSDILVQLVAVETCGSWSILPAMWSGVCLCLCASACVHSCVRG